MRFLRLILISAVICVFFTVASLAAGGGSTSNTFNITYVSEYGSFANYRGSTAYTTITITAAMLPSADDVDGYSFDGWYYNGSPVNVGDSIPYRSSISFTAQYNAVTTNDSNESASLSEILESITQLLDAAITWVASVSDVVSTTPLFLIAVVLAFVPVGISLFRRLL